MSLSKFYGPYDRWEDIPPELLTECSLSGYDFLRIIPGQSLCGLQQQIYTFDLLIGIEPNGYNGRYTFEHLYQAIDAILTWSGDGRPGNDWINHYDGAEGRMRNMQHPINKGYIGNITE